MNKKLIVALALMAVFFLAVPVFALDISNPVVDPGSITPGGHGSSPSGRDNPPITYKLTINAKDGSSYDADKGDYAAVTADKMTLSLSDKYIDSCTDCKTYTFSNLNKGNYKVEIIAKGYVPKNFSEWVAGNSQISELLTPDNSKPVTTISFSPDANANGWYNADVTVTLTATDSGSGVKTTYYSTDNGANFKVYNAAFKINVEGTTSLKYYSVDKAQNTENTNSATVKLDKTAPVVSVNGAPANWQSTDATASASANDATSGIDASSQKLYISDSKINACPADYSKYTSADNTAISSDMWVCAAAKDLAGNAGFSAAVEFKVDEVVPQMGDITAYTASNKNTEIPSGVWQTIGAPYFTWNDDNSGTVSGTSFYYTEDGSEPNLNSAVTNNKNVYDRTANAYNEGTMTLKIKPYSASGMWGETKTFVLKYDATAPVTTIALNPALPNPTGWYANDITVTLTCNDVLSGCAATKYSLDSGTTWTAYIAPFTLASDSGSITVQYYTVDNAGNVENTLTSATLKLDKTAPVGTNAQDPGAKTYASGADYAFSMDWSDATSGMNNVMFNFDGQNMPTNQNGNTYTVTVSDISAGNHNYYWTAMDNANNVKTTETSVYTVARATPATSIAFTPSATETFNTQTTATCTITKGDAGNTLKLFRDNSQVDIAPGSASETAKLDAGVHNYYCEYVESMNYSAFQSAVSTLTISKADPTLTLNFNGAQGDNTFERGTTVTISGASSDGGTVTLYIDDVATGANPYDYATGSVSLTAHKVTAKYAETANYNSAEKSYFLTVQDTTAPVITVTAPVNNSVIEQNWYTVTMTSNEDLNGATVSLDGATAIPMSGSGMSWSYELTNMGQDAQHYITVKGTDKGGLSTTSDKVYFTIPKLSHIVNTKIDGVSYADAYLNIHGTSTIVNAIITDSTVDASTIIDSTVSGKHISHMTIKGSNVDPADFTGSDIEYSTVTEDDANFITYSNATNSTISYTDMDNCAAWFSTIEYSSLKNMKIWNANISHNRLYTGIVEYNGINYTMPTDLANLQAGADTVAPIIDPLTVSNSTPAPGETVTFTAIAYDSVAVRDVTFDGLAMTFVSGAFANGYVYTAWTHDLAIPAANGTYVYIVKATDFAGNSRDRLVTVKIDTTATPQVTITIDPVPCEVLGNCPVTPPASGGGGGGSGGSGSGPSVITPLTQDLVIDAPNEIVIVPGQTAQLQVALKNAGTADLTDIRMDIMGLPVSWFIVNSKVTKLAADSTLTDVISISVPSTEEIGSKTVTISATSKEGVTATKTVTLKITLPVKPTQNQTGTGNQTSTSITGAFLGMINSPSAMALVVASVIVGGAIVWTRKYAPAKAAAKAEKTDRKFI